MKEMLIIWKRVRSCDEKNKNASTSCGDTRVEGVRCNACSSNTQ